jgi:hypothetical protein
VLKTDAKVVKNIRTNKKTYQKQKYFLLRRKAAHLLYTFAPENKILDV